MLAESTFGRDQTRDMVPIRCILMVFGSLILGACNLNVGSRGVVTTESLDEDVRRAVLPGSSELENLYHNIDNRAEVYRYRYEVASNQSLKQVLNANMIGWQEMSPSGKWLLFRREFPRSRTVRNLMITTLEDRNGVVFGFRDAKPEWELDNIGKLESLTNNALR